MPRFFRIWEIIGDRKRNIPPIIPVSRTAWLSGVKEGRYPKPVKLSAKSVAWTEQSIRELEQKLSGQQAA